MAVDMINGRPAKQIFLFSLPLLFGNFFQLLYTISDSIVIGQLVGADAFGSVSATGPLIFLLTSMIIGLGIGATIAISQFYGAGMYDDLRRTASTALIFLFLAGLVISAAGAIFARPLLILLKTGPEILDGATVYLRIIMMGILASIAYNAFTALMTALGDSKTPLIFLILSTVLNTSLDLLFIGPLRMGILGNAVSTVLAQAVAATACFIYMYRKMPLLRFHFKDMVFDREKFRLFMRLGLPSCLQQSVIAIGSVSIQSFVNDFGWVTTAAYAAGNRVEEIAFLPVMSLGNASSTFTGQNVGAGKLDRVKKGLHASLSFALAITVIFSPVIVFLGKYIMRLFIKSSDPNIPEIIGIGTGYMTVLGSFTFLVAVMFVYNSLLRGSGDVYAATISSFANIGVRILSAFLLSKTALGVTGIFFAMPIGWAVSLSISAPRYYSGAWKQKAVARRAGMLVPEDIDPGII